VLSVVMLSDLTLNFIKTSVIKLGSFNEIQKEEF
jgi:hypothetical protein